ncbi:MAG: glycosyltransferase family 4 protein [Oligoflexia bacterium]|nr:glycosyltransferase family 4 protein [Oligoflexia bacterium]
MKKRILFIVPSFQAGGAELFFHSLAKEFNKDNDVYFISLTKTKNEFNIDPSIKTIRINANRSISSLFKLFKVLLKVKPNHVFSTVIQANVVTSILSLFFKDIEFIARETLIPSLQYQTQRDKFFPQFVSMLLYPLFSNVIFQSQYMKDNHFSYFKSDFRYTVINNFISTQDNSEPITNRDQGNTLKMFTIARLHNVKQVDHMIKAAQIASSSRNIELHIFGDGPEREHLESLTKKLSLTSIIKFHGFIENPIKKCSQYDLFLLTSKYEGFPNAALDSISIGKPILSYKSPGGIQEIVLDQSIGKLTKVNDIKELSDAMISYKEEEYNSMEIRKRAYEMFGKEKIMNKYRKLIDFS